jgi:serine protease AprX
LMGDKIVNDSSNLAGIPSDLGDLFGLTYDKHGARIHSNSWGTSIPGFPYDSHADDIDNFVWENNDCVICFSAGNNSLDFDQDGIIDEGSIGSAASAKNSITIGASESMRENDSGVYGNYLNKEKKQRFTSDPIKSDRRANNPDGMAAFSCRGPTQAKRFKPDVVAPGTSILSTRSRAATKPLATVPSSNDPLYTFSNGTSMATPLVAGCCAVLRETLVKNGLPRPEAALIKALLINGAVELKGQYTPSEAGPSPNNSSGWGRVDLARSVILPNAGPAIGGFGGGGPLKEGEEFTFSVDIPAQSPVPAEVQTLRQPIAAQPLRQAVPLAIKRRRPRLTPQGGNTTTSGGGPTAATFKITVVWTDPPGEELQNDLDLIVIAKDGSERHGNMGTSKGFDRLNNVEQVLWKAMPAGPATITVRAARITRFPQSFFYAWRLD